MFKTGYIQGFLKLPICKSLLERELQTQISGPLLQSPGFKFGEEGRRTWKFHLGSLKFEKLVDAMAFSNNSFLDYFLDLKWGTESGEDAVFSIHHFN